MKTTKNLTFDPAFVQRVQSWADLNGVSFSSAVSILVNEKLDAETYIVQITKIQDFMTRAIRELGEEKAGKMIDEIEEAQNERGRKNCDKSKTIRH